MAIKTCIKVAVFSPIRGQFYYLPNDKEGIERYQKGQRVVVVRSRRLQMPRERWLLPRAKRSRLQSRALRLLLIITPIVDYLLFLQG